MKVEKAKIDDVPQMQRMINFMANRGELLPRALSELYENIRDFFVVREDGQVVACVALHVSWADLAEIRSLAVDENWQAQGLGALLVEACLQEAGKLGILAVFCLTSKPNFFENCGFQHIDKVELPRKIWSECYQCPKFPNCDEVALIYRLSSGGDREAQAISNTSESQTSMVKREQTLSTEQVYEGRAVKLRVDTVEKSNGSKTTREIVEHSDCVVVVPLDNQGDILLVRQYRKPVEKGLLELPAGGIEPGEDPVECVRRELREETGYSPQKIEELGGFYSTPGYCTEYLHLYLATELRYSPLVAEDTEGIELVRVPLSRIPGLIASGEICDAKSIAGLLRFIHKS